MSKPRNPASPTTPPDDCRQALGVVFRRLAARGRELRAARLARVVELVEAWPSEGDTPSTEPPTPTPDDAKRDSEPAQEEP